MTYNFTIGDLGFHKLVNDEHPYERATAPFRKEQFDTAPTVGDQSLTGWWTRGQLSFHRGEGVKYYEILDGEGVLNRYRSGESINPLTPGVVTLAPAVTEAVGVGAAADHIRAAAGVSGSETRFAWVEYAGSTPTIKRSTNGTVSTVANGFGAVQSGRMVGDAGNYYAATYDPAVVSAPTSIVKFSATSGGSASQIYTHTAVVTGIWFAKDRLWATDDKGAVFALVVSPSTTPQAIGSSDTVFTISDASPGDIWAFTAGPGPVYFGVKNRIYRVTPQDDGAVPIMVGGVVVAELALGESIRAMQYLLGSLFIGTTKGIRPAVVREDGSLTVGPLIVEGEVVGRSLAATGSHVHALLNNVRNATPGVRLVTVDAGGRRDEASFPYTTTGVPIDPAATTGAGVAAALGGVVVYGTTGTDATLDLHGTGDALAATGEVVTGLHRFGTLELKHFSGVSIRCAGDGGSIATYAVTPEGVETHLATIDAAESTGTDVSLVVNPPVESVALKFVLTRDTTDPTVGPELLGYQLKALPSPVRQRLIRVPLMLFDIERGATGRAIGKEKEAWTRLAALEALEESDSLVEFEDTETGETGTAYIETIEVLRRNGSKGNSRSNGFGGVVTITLRKVA